MSHLPSSPALPPEKSFGLLCVVLAVATAGYSFWAGHSGVTTGLLGALALVLLAVTRLRPLWLRPLNRAWFGLGLLLGRIVSPLVLGAIFFLLITPTALVMRMAGRDALRLRHPRAARSDSLWIERDPPGPPPQSLRQQF